MKIPWEVGQKISANVRYAGLDGKYRIILEADKWSVFFNMLLIDALAKYIFKTDGSDIRLVIRKIDEF